MECLGQGGMASVYLAYDTKLKRQVAIKIMHEHMQGRPNLRVRFHREAYSVSKLRHPNILDIYDFSGDDADQLWLVMEFIKGYDLNDYVACFPGEVIHPLVATCIIREVAKALSEAHAHGIIHRDIKASNIMVSDAGQIKLMDFGIAKDLIVDSELTQTGSFIGSPSYMSPEQIRGEDTDGRVDIYALSVLFFKLVTGRLPYDGDNTHEIMDRVLSQSIPKPKSIRKTIPTFLSQFIVKGLAKEADQRHQSIHEMVVVLDNYLRDSHFGDSGVELGLFFSDPKEFARKVRKNLKSLRAASDTTTDNAPNWDEIKKAHNKISHSKKYKKHPKIREKVVDKVDEIIKQKQLVGASKQESKESSNQKTPQKNTQSGRASKHHRNLTQARVQKLEKMGGVKKNRPQGTVIHSPRSRKAKAALKQRTQRARRKGMRDLKAVSTTERNRIQAGVYQGRVVVVPSARPVKKRVDQGWIWVVACCLVFFSTSVLASYRYGPQFYDSMKQALWVNEPSSKYTSFHLSENTQVSSAIIPRAESVMKKKPSISEHTHRPKAVSAVEWKKSLPAQAVRKPKPRVWRKPEYFPVGRVQAYVSPSAEVYLGDHYLGTSSQVFRKPLTLKAGHYQLRLKKQGYVPYERRIQIKDQFNLSLGKVSLKKIIYYSIAVQGPRGTKFSVKDADGRYLKSMTLVSSEYRLRLKKGEYEIMAVRKGKVFRRQVSLPSVYGDMVVNLVF